MQTEKYQGYNPIRDHDIVMTEMADIVGSEIPGYDGKVSMTFLDQPHPDNADTRFRGTVTFRPGGPIKEAAHFVPSVHAGKIGLMLDLAMSGGWLDYEGDIVIRLHAVAPSERITIERRSGHRIMFDFGEPPPNEPDNEPTAENH